MSEFRTALDALRECYMRWTDKTSIEEGNAREMHLIVRHNEDNNDTNS